MPGTLALGVASAAIVIAVALADTAAGKKRKRTGPKANKHTAGIEHAIYKKEVSGKWVRCEANDTDKTKLPDSIWDRYIREGHSVTGATERNRSALTDASDFVHRAQGEFNASKESKKAKSSQRKSENLSRAERFWLAECPNSEFSKMLVAMASCGDGDPDVHFYSMEETDIKAYLTYLQHTTDLITDLQTPASGRAVGYGTIAAQSTEINRVHAVARVHQPFKDNMELKEYLARLHDEYEGAGAPSFDFATDLEILWKANFDDNTKSDLEKIRDWAMILIMICMIARASEVCEEFCPFAESLEFCFVFPGTTFICLNASTERKSVDVTNCFFIFT